MYFGYGVWHELAMTFEFDAKTVTGSVDGTTLGILAINNSVAPSIITKMVLSTFVGALGGVLRRKRTAARLA